MLTLSRALAAKGHNLTVITTHPSKIPIENHREIDISYAQTEWKKRQGSRKMPLNRRVSPAGMMSDVHNIINFFTSLVFNSPNVISFMQEVNGTKFDLILYECLYFSSLLGFKEITGNPPVIGMSTFQTSVITDIPQGNPIMPALTPFPFLPYSDEMSLYERIYNLYTHFHYLYTLEFYIKPTQEMYLNKYFGKLEHTAEELECNKSLVIISTDLATGYARPVQPNIIYVGPLHIVEPDPLPHDLQDWMDESTDGVIYFSLGSNMEGSSIPEHIRTAFLKAFEQFPKIRVIWKWESDTKIPGQSDNVLVKKWLPQQSILAHPKVRLFVTQVGMQSLQEAINYGVPVLGMPIFVDQDFNGKKIVEAGAGLVAEFNKVSYEYIYERLKTLLTDERYKDNMRRLSNIAKDKTMSPVDTSIWWIEYVLRHNGAMHLRPKSLEMKWYQIYMLDIMFILIFSLIMIFILIYQAYIFITSFKFNKLKKN